MSTLAIDKLRESISRAHWEQATALLQRVDPVEAGDRPMVYGTQGAAALGEGAGGTDSPQSSTLGLASVAALRK